MAQSSQACTNASQTLAPACIEHATLPHNLLANKGPSSAQFSPLLRRVHKKIQADTRLDATENTVWPLVKRQFRWRDHDDIEVRPFVNSALGEGAEGHDALRLQLLRYDGDKAIQLSLKLATALLDCGCLQRSHRVLVSDFRHTCTGARRPSLGPDAITIRGSTVEHNSDGSCVLKTVTQI